MSKGYSFDQVLNLKQTTMLAPQLQQGVHLLHLSSLELQNEIETALESNPFLEKIELEFNSELQFEDSPEKGADKNKEHDAKLSGAPIHGRASTPNSTMFSQTNVTAGQHSRQPGDSGEQPMLQVADSHTLQSYLHEQARSTPLNDKQHYILELLIDSVNDNGYLRAKLDDIVELAMPDYVIRKTEVREMINVLQDFEPIGVGARTASECLLIQLHDKAVDTPGLEVARQISKHHLSLLAEQKIDEIGVLLNLDKEALKTAVLLIRTLNPFPGSVIARAVSNMITPDLVVKKILDRWVVRLNPNIMPSISMHTESDGLLKLARGKEGYETLKQEWQKAQTLLSNLEKRYRTLIQVASIIVERQNSYFDRGDAAIKPLAQKDIAAQLSVHVSTISRAVNDKYILTPNGVIELREFFSAALAKRDGGHISAKAVQVKIMEMIERESRQSPLSDQRIMVLLNEGGIQIARRTVTKYRERADIPASPERRKP